MNTNIVTTNLRIDKNDWLAVKATAGELGMSTNSLVQEALNHFIKDTMLGIHSTKADLKGKKRDSIWQLPELAEKIKRSPMGELSEEDKIIYET